MAQDQGMFSRPAPPNETVQFWQSITQWKTTCFLDDSFSGKAMWCVQVEETERRTGRQLTYSEFYRFEYREWRMPIGGGWDDVTDIKVVMRLESIVQAVSDMANLVANYSEETTTP